MSKSSIRRNQSRNILRAAIMSTPAVIAALSATNPARAVDLFWDINGATAEANGTATAAGTWDAATANWSTDAAGLAATQTWGGAGNTAVFAAGTSQTGAYTVTVSGTQTTDGVRFDDGSVTLSGGTLDFNTSGIALGRAATSTQVINSVITGTNGLNITRTNAAGTAGTVSLTLGGNNSYTGTTTINAAGTLSTVLQVTLTHNNALGATGAGNETVFGASPASDAAFLALGGNRVIAENLQLRGGGQAATSLGQLRNTAGTNTWSGNIVMNGLINNLGTGFASIGASAGTLVVTGLISSLNAGANTPGVGWGKMGTGTVVLRGTTPNTNVGLLRQFNGTLVIESDGALGVNTVDGSFDNAFLQLANNQNTTAFNHATGFTYTGNKGITLAGPAAGLGVGANGRAQLDNFGGNNTFAGFVRVGGASATGPTRVLASIGAQTGTSLELSGNLYTSASGAGTNPTVPDPREIHKTGGGNLIISGTNDTVDGVTSGDSDQYKLHGTFVIDAGTLTLRSTNPVGGAFAGSSNGPMNFQVNLGGTLALDNTLAVNTARIGATAAITLSAGEVKLIGNADTSVNQPGGAVNVAGYSTITVQQPASTAGATTTFSLGTLTRSNRGTALLRGINNTTGFAALSGTLKGGVGGAGTTTIPILTEVVGDASSTGDGTDFVTVDGGFARVLSDGAGEYLTLASGNTALDNTKVTANTAISANTTVNSIKLTGGVSPTTVTIGGGNTLLVNSGGILGVGASGTSSAINGGNLSFETTHIETDGFTGATSIVVDSANEGIITVPSGATLTIGSDVHGDQGLTKSGQGTLRLTGTNTYGANTLAVTDANRTTINAGVLEFNTDSNLGAANANISINGGTLRPLATSTSARNVSLDSPAPNIIDTGTGADFTITGIVSGRALTKNGAGVLTLTNIGNTYSGGTTINAGTMFLDATDADQSIYGTGGITLNGGIIRTNTTMTLDKSLVSTSTNTTGGFYIASGAVLTFGSSPASLVGMSGSGNYAINGGGTLRLSQNTGAAMVYTGRLIVNDGSTLAFDAAGTNTIAGIGGTPVSTAEWVVLNSNSRLQFTVTSNAGAGFSGSTRGITVNNSGIIDITGTNIVINTAGITGATGQTIYKDGTGLYSLRIANAYAGKWNILDGTLEFGAPTNNAASLGTGSGADFITIQNGKTLTMTTTSGTGTMAANQGITLAGASATFGMNGGAGQIWNIPGDITAGAGKTLNKTGSGRLNIKNFRGDTFNQNGGTVGILANATPYTSGANDSVSSVNTWTGLTARKLDLTNAKLITNDVSFTTPVYDGVNDIYIYDGVHGLVQAGRNPLTGTWDGTSGITTSQTEATTGILTSLAVGTGAELRGLGPTDTELFGGQTIDGDSTIVMYTYGGDADMDGDLDGDDYFYLDSNVLASETIFGWHQGDFNYDGRLNGDDYFILDSNILQAQASGNVFYVRDPEFAASGGGAAGLTAVPEPASLGLLGLGAMSLLGRRRRKM